MKGLLACMVGMEDVAVLEVKELLGKDATLGKGYVVFDISSHDELCLLAYRSQTASLVMLVLDEQNAEKLPEIQKKPFDDWLTPERTFRVDVSSSEAIDKQNLREQIGASLILQGVKNKVHLETPDLLIHCFVSEDKAFLGIDFGGVELDKRSYRIFSNPRMVRAPLSYAMVRWSGFKEGTTFCDPFCLVGSAPIEAALWLKGHPVRFYDQSTLAFTKFMNYTFVSGEKKEAVIYAIDSQFRNVDSAKKNAKIAGIHKDIVFSRQVVEWLDIKFNKGQVDSLVSCLPTLTKEAHTKIYLKIIKEFLHQVAYVLNPQGKAVICSRNPEIIEKEALERGLQVLEKKIVWQGKEELPVLILALK